MSTLDETYIIAILAPEHNGDEVIQVLTNSARTAQVQEETTPFLPDAPRFLPVPPAWFTLAETDSDIAQIEAYQRLLITSAEGLLVLAEEGSDHTIGLYVEYARAIGIPDSRIDFRPEVPEDV